jgi:hypothetical protein
MATNYHKYIDYQRRWQKDHRSQLNEYHSKKYHEQIKYNQNYYCDICEVNLIYRLNYEKHIQTKKHTKNEIKNRDDILKEERLKKDSYYHNHILNMINSKYIV